MPYFNPITSQDITYDLSHLEPFSFSFFSNNAQKDLTVHVTFSNHCFSKKLSDEPDSAHEIVDETQGRERVFCPIRYELSKTLPNTIKTLNHPSVKVWETSSRRNWCYTIQIDNPEGPYHIFFEIRKNQKTQKKKQDLNMVVESAYHETDEPPKLIGRIGFYILCTNVYLGRKTSTKR